MQRNSAVAALENETAKAPLLVEHVRLRCDIAEVHPDNASLLCQHMPFAEQERHPFSAPVLSNHVWREGCPLLSAQIQKCSWGERLEGCRKSTVCCDFTHVQWTLLGCGFSTKSRWQLDCGTQRRQVINRSVDRILHPQGFVLLMSSVQCREALCAADSSRQPRKRRQDEHAIAEWRPSHLEANRYEQTHKVAQAAGQPVCVCASFGLGLPSYRPFVRAHPAELASAEKLRLRSLLLCPSALRTTLRGGPLEGMSGHL